jgi:hypothetical protein
MLKLPILRGHVTEVEKDTDTINVFPVKALNQQTAAIFTLKALSCLLIALMTLYLYIVLRLYTLPQLYEHNCITTVQDLDTFDENELHILI